jgi:uncharacterized protein DUF2252
MDICKATQKYESWLAGQIPLIQEDLDWKHAAMAKDMFSFLRATFYRWMQLWPEVCRACDDAPTVLGAGDLHIENFGTWRDVEGRLVWGVNDFDEACALPYTLDLVRLAASAHLAIAEDQLKIKAKDACTSIMDGYEAGLAVGGKPFVLAEHHHWLRETVSGVLRDPEKFWTKLDRLPTLRKPIPSSACKAIERLLPESGLDYRVVHRIAGLGSLGRERYVAIADYRGGAIAREAKALAPSAAVWANKTKKSGRIRYQEILDASVRSPDPFVRLKGRWIVRRLAPDCSRVELASMPKERDESRLLYSMGFEIANVHLGSPKAPREILRDLQKRPGNWLHQAAAKMVARTVKDWHEWRGGARRMN